MRVPRVVAGIIAATAIVSVLAAVGSRNGAAGMLGAGLLVVPAVWHGQIWRLVTWVFYELDVLPLVFACLTLYWFAGDLAREWGARRLLAVYLGIAASAAAVTCLVGLVWQEVALIPQAGSWPVLDALLVAWGLTHPDREMRVWGLFRLTGRQLVWITLIGTLLYALFRGLAGYVPHMAAELLMLAWLGPGRRLIARTRRAREARGRAWKFEDWMSRNR
jgi:membrane associated rhomboid family serine protease